MWSRLTGSRRDGSNAFKPLEKDRQRLEEGLCSEAAAKLSQIGMNPIFSMKGKYLRAYQVK